MVASVRRLISELSVQNLGRMNNDGPWQESWHSIAWHPAFHCIVFHTEWPQRRSKKKKGPSDMSTATRIEGRAIWRMRRTLNGGLEDLIGRGWRPFPVVSLSRSTMKGKCSLSLSFTHGIINRDIRKRRGRGIQITEALQKTIISRILFIVP